MTQITAYICSKNAGEIDVETPEKDGISESESQVVAYIQPVSPMSACRNGVGLVTAYIMETGSDEYCNQGNDLSWSRVTKDIEGKPTGNVYPVIRFETPPHCHWITSVLKFYGTPDISDLVGKLETSIYPDTGDGECSDNKDEVFGGGNTINHIVNQNRIIPGHRLELEVYFNNGDETVIKKSVSKYWCTGSIYGGIVTAVNGDYGDVNITYTVIISGESVECKSSDFAEYSVGDWVFVGKTACETEISVTDCSPGDSMAILPLKVNGYGTISRDHEYMEFGLNEVPELFDACVLNGQIIEIAESGDFADIELGDLGRQNDIPIFYHCPLTPTIEDGKKAFKADDDVRVLVTGMQSVAADYCVVGFPGGPRICKCLVEEDFLGQGESLVYSWDLYDRSQPYTYTYDCSIRGCDYVVPAESTIELVKNEYYWTIAGVIKGPVMGFTVEEEETVCLDGMEVELEEDTYIYYVPGTEESYSYFHFLSGSIYYRYFFSSSTSNKWLIIDMDLEEFTASAPNSFWDDPCINLQVRLYTSPITFLNFKASYQITPAIVFNPDAGGAGRKKYATNIGPLLASKYWSYYYMAIAFFGYFPEMIEFPACAGRTYYCSEFPGGPEYSVGVNIYSIMICEGGSAPADAIIF